ncbi:MULTISPECIES: hypothetical protein [Stenotrophomonas]|uniref:hypothetical protein n=1 Tax=Stenotrophomonas TaxID=40323 RepID=UPI0015DFEDFB|nr:MULTISPECIES: hypothetical protein [Stenotrophomonas]MBA0428423.1 hypothetical protein [Stenotrophomonas maltophilia]MDH0276134.1 hypothetical protein [Stenotrophomonas sp. GD04089]MDH1911005.1 hypothetical protein [Stenotrophomonas sp. GD03794]
MSAPVDVLEDLRAEIRRGGRTVTAFRLGSLVGRNGIDVACPYKTDRSVKLYREGVEFGQLQRTKERAA